MAEDYARLLAAIDSAEESAYGSDGSGDLENDRARAIDYFLGNNTNPAPEGRSQVQDRSVFETIQWILPSLIDIFANGDDIVELAPVSEEDEEPAKQEAQYLNYIALQKNAWFLIMLTWLVDAMLTKNAYLYVYKDKRRTTEVERYEKQTAEGLALLLQDKDVEVIQSKEYPDPSGEMEPIVGPDGQPQMQVTAIDPVGQPVMQPAMKPKMLYDVAIRRTQEEQSFCIEALPPERTKCSEKTPSFLLNKCPYFEYWDFVTLSDLRADGLDVEDDIADDDQSETAEDSARDQFDEQTGQEDRPTDPSMRRVKARYIWIKCDHDEDGIAEMQYVIRVGQEVLFREEVGRIPVACTVPIPLPHRHMGLSIADIVMDLQDIKRAILRGGLDNLYLSNNPQKVINSETVNLEDALVSRPGGIVRVKGGIPAQDYVPIPMPFVFPQAMEGLEYMDQVKENRTGTNRYFTGIDQNSLNKTASGVQTLTTMAAQRVKLIARIIGTSLAEMFSILHEQVLKSGHKAEVVKLRNKWVTVDPATWKKRKDFNLSVGYASGNKDALVSRLMLILQAQKEALAIGVASPRNIYEALMELTKASDFASPQRFWTDPSTVQPQQPQPDVTVMAAEKLKSDTNIFTTMKELEQKERESIRDADLERFKIETDARVKVGLAERSAQDAKDLEKTRAEKAVELEDMRMSNDSSLEQFRLKNDPKQIEANAKAQDAASSQELLRQFLASQDAQTKTIAAMFEQLAGAMTAEREIVRDPKTQRVMGSRIRSNGKAN